MLILYDLSKLCRFLSFLKAEAGGFEPPVQLPVRQFSKLVVSATHPHFLNLAIGGLTPNAMQI